jgi:hypothetical protein
MLAKRKKEDNECQQHTMPLGEDHCGMRSKSPGDCSKPRRDDVEAVPDGSQKASGLKA